MTFKRLTCPSCQASFGQERRFLDHLTSVHGVHDHLSLYLQLNHSGVHPTCTCDLNCTERLTWSGWKKGFVSRFVRGHNSKLDSAYFDKDKQRKMALSRTNGYKTGDHRTWNKGLTKETDDRIKKQSSAISIALIHGHASGSIVSWQSRDPMKAVEASQKSKKTMQRLHDSGALVPWNKGLTKGTNPSLMIISKKISDRYSTPDAGNRIKRGELERRIAVHKEKFTLLSDVNDYTTRRVARLRFRCNECGSAALKSLAMLEESPVCYRCHPLESKGQLELYDFVKSLAPDAMLSDRNVISPLELDVYVGSHRFGIEYDGLYYHSELNVDDRHAVRKMDAVKAKNVTFLRVFEDEWRDKRQIVESMIKHRLGIFGARIGARQCCIRELSSQERRSFIDANHLDGDVNATISWGLVHGDELLAAVSLRRPFHKKYIDTVEVARFCIKKDINVPGALARLSKHALSWARQGGKNGLMTYVDQRIGLGNGYLAAGYRLIDQTSPRFWWTDFHDRFDRFRYRADKKRGLSEHQVAEESGVVRIHGCSNVVFLYGL